MNIVYMNTVYELIDPHEKTCQRGSAASGCVALVARPPPSLVITLESGASQVFDFCLENVDGSMADGDKKKPETIDRTNWFND